jgi:hypothetical protein
MANSSNTPKKRASKKARSTAAGWGQSRGEDLELPSGNVCLITRPGLPELLAAGILPNSLLQAAQVAVQNGKSNSKKKRDVDSAVQKMRDEAMADPAKMVEMFDAFDRVTSFCVQEPKCLYYKDDEGNIIPEEQRDYDHFLYSDRVALEDKTFIFNFVVGGTRDIEQFRKESAADVAAVRPVQDVALPA